MQTTSSVDDLEVRPPKQQRSREAWNRVLDAGVAILEDGGYDAFTIAAVCERAAVAPTAIYARTTSKDALFLAVYEHGIGRLRAEQGVFADSERWAGLPPADAGAGGGGRDGRDLAPPPAVPACRRPDLGGPSGGTASGLPLQPGARTRASPRWSSRRPATITHPDPEAAVRSCFGTVFATSIIRVAYGPGFATPSPVDDDAFVADLGETAVRYLLADLPG